MDKLKILEMVQNGELTLEQAMKLLENDIDTESIGDQIKNVMKEKIENFRSKIDETNKEMIGVNEKIKNMFDGKKYNYNFNFSNNDVDSDEELSGWDAIIKLAPFASTTKITSLIEKELCKEENIDWDKVIKLAPFIEDEVLGKICQKIFNIQKPDFSIAIKLAPFLKQRYLEELISHCEDTISIKVIMKLAPFLSENFIDELIDKLAN